MTRSARSSFRRKAITALVAAGGATAILAGAQPAAAAVVTQTIAVPDKAVVSVQATCPKGQRATGGGWEFTTRTSNKVQIQPHESRKIGQNSWILTVSRNDPPPAPAATASVIVYCFKWAPKTKEVVALTSSPDDYVAFDTADAVCPGNRTVQSGGFSIPLTTAFDPFAEVIESYRVAEGTWRARMDGGKGAQLATYAYCAKGKAPTEQVGTLQVANNVPANFTTVTPECSKKRKTVAGGFAQPTAFSNPMDSAWAYALFQFFRAGKAWQASGTHFGDPTTFSLYAYCVKKPEDDEKK